MDRKDKNNKRLDKKDVLNIAKKYAIAIRNKFEFNRIYLFGSRIRGDFHEESDIDIAVIFNDFENILNMQLELMRIRRKIDSRIEPHPFREKDFTNSNPIVYEILKYGEQIKV